MRFYEKIKSLWMESVPTKTRQSKLKEVYGGKIYMPHYGRCEYNCLEELIQEQRNKRSLYNYRYMFLNNVVQYNIRFRDCLRIRGIEGVIRMLIEECPSLSNEEEELDDLRKWWKERMEERIGDYDIQCYPRDAQLKIYGCLFNGLSDVESQIEMSASDKYRWDETEVYSNREYKLNSSGLHVGQLWMSYPTFDSYDASDGRSYDNYIIRKNPITAGDMKQLSEVRRGSNACRVHESIDPTLLPIIYHDGDDKYILVATAK